ncbi:MAG: class I SAM-dependent methyltransferase [Bacteroidales bacterium]|nr:class I SAM-dependent methyltransferase [Bacteroidales bacterium]
MQPNYKNWMPTGMVLLALSGSVACLIIFCIFNVLEMPTASTLKIVLKIIFLILTIALALVTLWLWLLHRAFSYNGTRQMAKQIIEGVSTYVAIPEHGKGLDVGCGSGALTIAVAKRNPKTLMVGIDRWGGEYASYSRALCEKNAAAEGVGNTIFIKGNALKLDFDDGTFDTVCSNYVYHNIPSRNRQAILLETLRVLKKGGTFAIHDIFARALYGDMNAFMQKLKDMGYERVEMIDTTNGMFMTPWEATWMLCRGSAILTGKK